MITPLPLNDEITIHAKGAGALETVPAYVTWKQASLTLNEGQNNYTELVTTHRLVAQIEPVPGLSVSPTAHDIAYRGRRYPISQVLPRLQDGRVHHYTITMDKETTE